MNDAELDLPTVEDMDRELRQIVFQGVQAESRYRAAQLFGKISEFFEAARGKTKLKGLSSFNDWARDLTETRSTARGLIYDYVRVGRYLLPQVGEADFATLGIKRATILANIAKAQRLTSEFLKASFALPVRELEEKAAPLLGKRVSWEDRLQIECHEAAEAALIQLGNLLEYDTYTADAARSFQGKKLGEIATLPKLPRFPSEEIDRSASRIDVVWAEEEWPRFFFEVESTTNVTSGLQRMFQVVKLDAKFFIVGPKSMHTRFARAISQAPYRQYKDKYLFRSYPELKKMFQAALKFRDAKQSFFAKE